MSDDLIETIADFMHEQWGHWMKYLFSKGGPEEVPMGFDDPYKAFCFNIEDYQHWKKQTETPYSQLSEKEKDSDREWARRMVKLFQDYLNKMFPIFIGCIYGDKGCSGIDDGVYACERHA